MRGPIVLFAAWALHDAEETLTFPASADYVADLTGIDALRMTTKQSVAAIGLVGAALAAAGIRGGEREVTPGSIGPLSPVSKPTCSLICSRQRWRADTPQGCSRQCRSCGRAPRTRDENSLRSASR